ncbi:MAG: NAD-dependent epimerase/dehydratase family protein [Desulfobulbus sp.]|nr:NAD-dependent epimerase/dehydratase family protein [Desulfobulbus sp.]
MPLISGATGFIGSRLARALGHRGVVCMALGKRLVPGMATCIASLDDPAALSVACQGAQTVFHCAGHDHALAALSRRDAGQHWLVNFEGTSNLIEAAGQVGVQRFVFLSSVEAMAEPGDMCADEDFPGKPETAYGQSKRAAEEAVLEAGRRHGMHVVNLRLPMVYGSGGQGNLERMGRLVGRGLFPPLPETGNRRSLVHVDDVVAAMLRVAEDDRANGRTYIVAGSEAPSGRQLYDALREVLGLPPCRWSIPAIVLRGAARCGDRLAILRQRRVPLDSEAVARLLGSAWYSSARIERELGWQAAVSLREGLREMFGC